LQYPSQKKILYFQRGPRPKKVTGGPGWLRYATVQDSVVVVLCRCCSCSAASYILYLQDAKLYITSLLGDVTTTTPAVCEPLNSTELQPLYTSIALP